MLKKKFILLFFWSGVENEEELLLMSYVGPYVCRRCQCTVKYPGFLDSRQGNLMYFCSAVFVFAYAADVYCALKCPITVAVIS